MSSFTLGRLPQIPTNAITVGLPPIVKEDDDEEWIAYGIAQARKPSARSSTFNRIASLSKIVNSTLLMFFAPSQTLSGSLLLSEYAKYQNWFENLPENLRISEDSPSHTLSL